jgi:type I restriction enzyme, S subunit
VREMVPFSDLADVNPPRRSIQLLPDSEVSFIPMSDVTDTGQWYTHQSRRLSEVRHGYTYFEEGDVLFAKITPCMENGKGCLALGLKNGLGFGSTEFHVLRAKPNASNGFIYHWSVSRQLRLKATVKMTGSAGQQRVPANFFDDFKIPNIPKPEQQKIAQVLSTIDRALEQTQALIAKYQRAKIGLMQDLLTRGIDEHGRLRHPDTHEFKDSRLGRIPVEWEEVTLGELCDRYVGKIQTGPFGSQLHAHEYVKDGIPVIMPQDIQETGSIDLTFVARITETRAQSLSRHLVMQNDIVFARRGDLSRCAPIPSDFVAICGTGCLLVRLPEEQISAIWLGMMYRFSSSQIQILARAVGSTMVNLNTTLLRDLILPIPKIHEQLEIVERVQHFDSLIGTVMNKLSKLETLKAGLMQDLLSGRRSVQSLLEEGATF